MRMQQRRKTAATWTSSNEQLLDGELGIESDTGKWKVGDGATLWNTLAYQPSNAGITAAISAAVANLVNGAPGAVDTLKELADALGDDPNFATTVTNQIAAKANTSSLAPVATAGTYTSLTGKPTLGTAAAAATSDFDAAGAAAAAQAASLQKTSNLADLASAATARTNLGLGTAATSAATAFDAAGAASTAQAAAIQRANHTGTQPASTITGLATVATSGAFSDLTGAPTTHLSYRGTWTASTAYVTNDVVTYNGATYRAGSSFTSAATFTPANWTILTQPVPGTLNTGFTYYTAGLQTTGTSATIGNTTLRLHPFVLPHPVTVSRIGVEVTTAGESAAVVRLGIYADSSGIPGGLLLDAGTVAANAVAAPEVTGLTLTLPAGPVWIATVVQSAATTQPTLRTVTSAHIPAIPLQYASAATGGVSGNHYQISGTVTGALPGTISLTGASYGATHPRVSVRV